MGRPRAEHQGPDAEAAYGYGGDRSGDSMREPLDRDGIEHGERLRDIRRGDLRRLQIVGRSPGRIWEERCDKPGNDGLRAGVRRLSKRQFSPGLQ